MLAGERLNANGSRDTLANSLEETTPYRPRFDHRTKVNVHVPQSILIWHFGLPPLELLIFLKVVRCSSSRTSVSATASRPSACILLRLCLSPYLKNRCKHLAVKDGKRRLKSKGVEIYYDRFTQSMRLKPAHFR